MMASQAGGSRLSAEEIRSISFDPADADWVDTLVDLLREAGYAKAARAEVVRTALQGLHHVLAGRTRTEMVTFFLDREAERLLVLRRHTEAAVSLTCAHNVGVARSRRRRHASVSGVTPSRLPASQLAVQQRH
jgi:hypothetical protein